MFYCSSDNNSEGLEVYMHILQLLTTVDEGIQTIGMFSKACNDKVFIESPLIKNFFSEIA